MADKFAIVGGERNAGKTLAATMELLEELDQYRAIGTVEELREIKESTLTGLELAHVAVALDKLKEYESIGTPSECREAMEKQKAKRPSYSGDGYADGHLVYDTYECPNCGKQYEVDYDDYDHCPNCGQRFDMTMEEEDA